jgi:hypothetical protein
MFGKLTWAAIPFNEPIPLITSIVVLLVIFGVLGLVTIKGWWPYLWDEWITSTDHKRIGVMYIILALEDEFGVEFADAEVARLSSAAQLLDLLAAKAGAGAAGR